MANSVSGKVSRIYSNSAGAYIRLSGIPAADTPKNGYFQLKMNHSNYNALYSLALTAATNRQDLRIRINGQDISPTGDYPTVSYMVVDW